MKNKGSIISKGAVIAILTLIVIIIVGNIIIIGDKIANVSSILAYLFYIVVGVIGIWLVLVPTIRMVTTPQIKGIGTTDIDSLKVSEVSEYIKELKANINLTKDEEKRLDSGIRVSQTIKDILNSRYEQMEKVIKTSAVSNFAITAISQNGSLDMISSLVINIKMINSIIGTLGKRPSYSQLFKLYFAVLSSSLLITTIDDIIEDIDLGQLLGVGGKALDVVLPSITNGFMNAFVTLRVGYATIKYLEVGNKDFDKEEARKYAFASASKNIIGVGKEGLKEVFHKGKQMFKVLGDLF